MTPKKFPNPFLSDYTTVYRLQQISETFTFS